MKKYILKAKAGIGQPEELELQWTEEDFKKYEQGDQELQDEARGFAYDITDFEYFVEEVNV